MPPRTDNFQKFVKQKKGSAIKEEIKQHKKKEKKERAAAIDAHYEKKRAERLLMQQQPAAPATRQGRPNKYPKNNTAPAFKKEVLPVKNFEPAEATVRKNDAATNRQGRPDKYPKNNSAAPSKKEALPAQPARPAEARATKNAAFKKLPEQRADTPVAKPSPPINRPKSVESKGALQSPERATGEQMPLNKYIAHGGLCSRRDAAVLVKEGKVTVNDTAATDPGMKISPGDVVKVGNKKVIPSRNFVYILLNKPKDYITTSEDPQGRKTVLDLVRTATTERVYPVGRLDRNTSGVLLLTNDGELAQKLSHPKHEVKKVYEVKLDRSLTKGDMDKIASGITLEDGFVAPDVIAYADAKDKSIIGVEIHSGRNRIVRRIFEHLKYDVKGLDRVMFAGLTKKDVQRGKWRFLKEREVRLLKFMNQSFVKVRE